MSTPAGSRLVLRAPLSGRIVALERVPDPVFARRIAGDGFAIDPCSQRLLAPCAGRLVHVHAAGHALTIRAAGGVEILLHVGLDTVSLAGEGFRLTARPGDAVEAGTPLLEFDAALLAARGRTAITLVVVTTPALVERLAVREGEVVAGADVAAEIDLREDAIGSGTEEAASVTSPPIRVGLRYGLHARPAAALARAARAFDADVRLLHGEASANARSLVSLMALDVRPGDTVRVIASGADAPAAVARVTSLLSNDIEQTAAKSPEADARCPPAAVPHAGGALRGIGASPGVVAGRVFRPGRPEDAGPDSRREPIGGLTALSRALETAQADLRRLRTDLDAAAGDAAAAVLAAQEALLADPELVELAEAAVRAGHGAAAAWDLAIDRQATRLDSLPNPMLALRAHDLRDVGGRVRRLLLGHEQPAPAPPPDSVIVAAEMAPSEVASIDTTRVLGLCTVGGGVLSHAAILARALGLPVVVGLDPRALELADGTLVVLDGEAGTLQPDPPAGMLARVRRERVRHEARHAARTTAAFVPAYSRDGVRIEVAGNVGAPPEAEELVALGGDGIGLLRTEFLFLGRAEPPTEQEQVEVLAAMAATLGRDRPIVVRVLDAGGDKPLPFLPAPPASNPLLGERGLRLLLERPEVLRAQLRAVLRASAHGRMRIMFPMVARLEDWRAARAIFLEEASRLGIAPVPVGPMVEVPAAAILADAFAAEADFLSLGTNDLAQYVLGMDRNRPAMAGDLDALHPAVLRLVARTADAARAARRPVSVCGSLAADPQAIPILLGLGVDTLSVNVPAIPAVKARVRALEAAACRRIALRALEAASAAEVRALAAGCEA